MVTCLVWAGVLVVVLLLLLVVGWSMVIGVLPLWPPVLVAAITFYLLKKVRLPGATLIVIAGASILAFAIDLPFGLPAYSLAMKEIGYTGAFGGAVGFGLVDLPRLLWLSLPFCLLGGVAAASGLAALPSLGEAVRGTRRRRRVVTSGRKQH
jgi:hypothetical protein